jgi:DNA polymerase III delta prime subunit
MRITGVDFFSDLSDIHNNPLTYKDKYPRLRSLLERLCKNLTSEEFIQFSNLFSRLNFICSKTKLDKIKTSQIHSFRINANRVLHSDYSPTELEYLHDLKALSNAISHFYSVDVPIEIQTILPEDNIQRAKPSHVKEHARLRVVVENFDDDFIYFYAEDNLSDELLKLKHHVPGINEEFNTTISNLWIGCQLNLIDVSIDSEGVYFSDYIILEPDYLVDISSLAECMKEYGSHPLNYIKGRFETVKNSKHILLGNIANVFLDEFVNENSNAPVIYKDSIKKAFKSSPFEFSTCEEIDPVFFQDALLQYGNIKNVVSNVFPSYGIDRDRAYLEPSFICEHLGIQGRLDYLQLQSNDGNKYVIELKSGKAPYPESNLELIGKNHKAQAFLYQIIIQKILGVRFQDLSTYIFYSKYTDTRANLRKSQPYKAAIREFLNIRNLIVANERKIAVDRSESNSRSVVNSITTENLITSDNVSQSFIENYIAPQINQFNSIFHTSSTLELDYFHSFYSFVTREHYISKAGDSDYESNRGVSALWLSTIKQKIESGEILIDLVLLENLTHTELPLIKLKIPNYDFNFLPNFRVGDIVVLYERNKSEDNVTNKQIFKGAIQSITPDEIEIRIRYQQRNSSTLPIESKYAVEHDFLDSSYNTMYKGLYSFLQANQDRKDLLLNQRSPQIDESKKLEYVYDSNEIKEILSKAKKAKDYFLLVGPPGTGKTSIALRSMVNEFLHEPNTNILLMSYTNRAIDEICDALNKVNGAPDYIRIGSELSCDKAHRSRLLEEVIKDCDTRDHVREKIQKHRIFVGTVSSISSKTELFKLKTFQVSIIDEASQILEPSLIGVLSAKNNIGANAIEKFILIGDYKQLPAVVLQKEADSKVETPNLNDIGLFNRRNSLFERLYGLQKNNSNSMFWGMLHKQGRMHPDIALFPNYAFYSSQLKAVPTDHQNSSLEYGVTEHANPFEKLITTRRIAFIPSDLHKEDKTSKTNTYEALIVSQIVKNIFELYQLNNLNFSAENTIGIIAPYRSQIALIKREIHNLNIPELNSLSIDTVERFQGSQRDIIIYSFSVNQYDQLSFLSNNIEDAGEIIDRKLNVAITRARKQLFVTGNPSILSNNLIYYRFIEFIRSKSGYINAHPREFLQGLFKLQDAETNVEIGNSIYEPDERFVNAFDEVVIQKIKSDTRTVYPKLLYGASNDFIRNNVIEFGRTNFDEAYLEHSSADKVNLYCYFNMRKHYFSSIAIYKSFTDFFRLTFSNSSNRINFIDFGCGPLTSGLAFQHCFSSDSNFHFDYVGIDISNAMLHKAKEFSTSGLFNRNSKFQFVNSLEEVSKDYWESAFVLSNTVVLNFSYIFANLSDMQTEMLAVQINAMIDSFPLNKYVLVFQNSSIEQRNRSYIQFKKLVPRLRSLLEQPKTEKIIYRNAIMSNFDKSEEVFYELLAN